MSQRLARPGEHREGQGAGRLARRREKVTRDVEVALPPAQATHDDRGLRLRVDVVDRVGAGPDVGRELERAGKVALQRPHERAHGVGSHDDVREPRRLGFGADAVGVRGAFVDAVRQDEEPGESFVDLDALGVALRRRVRVRRCGQVFDSAVAIVEHHARVAPPLVQVAEHVVGDDIRMARGERERPAEQLLGRAVRARGLGPLGREVEVAHAVLGIVGAEVVVREQLDQALVVALLRRGAPLPTRRWYAGRRRWRMLWYATSRTTGLLNP